MDFANRSDDSGSHQFHSSSNWFASMSLIAHLRLYFVVNSALRHQTGFVERMCQRFLAINVLAQRHGPQSRYGMYVVWCAYRHRIDAFFVVEHDAEILVDLRRRMFLNRTGGTPFVDIA